MKFLTVPPVSLLMVVLATVTGYPQNSNQKLQPEDQQNQRSSSHLSERILNDDHDMYMEALEQQTELSNLDAEPSQGSQTLYPSFSSFQDQPLGHSRPFYYQQEGAYSHRPSAYQQLDYDTNTRFSGYKGETYNEPSDPNDLLGSGNFAILKGGTFYNDNDGESSYDNYYYQNGHGRPSVYLGGSSSNTRAQKYQQFENFRDFADINTPSSPEYSQFVVVYANKNDTSENAAVKPSSAPKNIIERLAMLDLELTSTTESAPTKKLSSSKRKLALILPEKKMKRKDLLKHRMTTPRDLYEPLLALS